MSFYATALLLLFTLFAFTDSQGAGSGALAGALVKVIVFAAELFVLVFLLLAGLLFAAVALGPIGLLALAAFLFVAIGWQQRTNFVVVSLAFLALVIALF